jgi:hypothetical protein
MNPYDDTLYIILCTHVTLYTITLHERPPYKLYTCLHVYIMLLFVVLLPMLMYGFKCKLSPFALVNILQVYILLWLAICYVRTIYWYRYTWCDIYFPSLSHSCLPRHYPFELSFKDVYLLELMYVATECAARVQRSNLMHSHPKGGRCMTFYLSIPF